MKTTLLVVMAAMTGASLCAGQSAAGQKATVTVCIDPDPHVLMGVRPMASAMFASIGVKIDWHERDSCPAGVGAIQVRISYHPPGIRKFKTMAFAQPDRRTIVVFPGRVQGSNRHEGPSVMAHVLVHEITHVLQGISRHSATGIMKDQWDENDYSEMRRKPLRFTQEDVDLIYEGLRARSCAVLPGCCSVKERVSWRQIFGGVYDSGASQPDPRAVSFSSRARAGRAGGVPG
jgi:hypothetical protein